MFEKKIEDVIREHTDKLIALPGVVGIGEGELNGKPCIFIFVHDDEDNSRKEIPSDLEGYPLVIKKSGKFSARE
jgi:hypothetical protein